MTDAEKLAKLRQMLDSTDDTSDDICNTYLTAAEKAIIQLAFPYGDGSEVLPSKYDYEQIEIAAYFLNTKSRTRPSFSVKHHIQKAVSTVYSRVAIFLRA